MNFKPLSNKVLVKRVDASEKSQGGIFIPGIARELPLEGVVIAVGPGKISDTGLLVPMSVKVDDRVVFSSRYVGVEIIIEGTKYVLLAETEIAGIVG